MNYAYHAQTDPGLTRPNNEDSFLFDEHCGVAVLADGMGGYSAGEVASSMATSLIASELTRWLSRSESSKHADDLCRLLALSVDKANREILQAAIANPSYKSMGTTVVAAVFLGDRLFLTHVGDSRCYRLRDGVLEQITKDHSMLQEQVDSGLITRAHAARAPGRNLLTRALGVESRLPLEVKIHPVEVGDLYLLCSDGLTDMVDDASMASLMSDTTELAQRASALIQLANAKGGRDNVTVMLIHAQQAPGAQGLARPQLPT
ncbi:Stp1/IreP family PP2C-type Ser/Thr phosphatase [Rhodoferax sp.]|uniref:Stp1/IreP family PP2C-type Ser/Thr phosphatase n=2 Tax=Rhodoferax sp. TaxID=50421 RepID=UPI002722186E|nr:Stp1/IreP family PP2C-type Ser/Thr phosphatase [Rhodoferax sp.]MDO9144894.1 Stp1/IreP family PP2C-type Ser/Thr phosphatase [Rhodoferax sp.]MDP1529891.1 Stp1/IreP family PP2C-type Ser/Thr phosphatase [Rhodoferax sp.]MDP1944583.1 Stp1/IreP family PP2C-type Ser/Thr phosphatase [Rhodoferax sp.]MDP2440632.1 Stp1/IreP family PP2C-type Ser/Thr phosphatase [Rhodoferax sp.]MDP3192191.1 Stp1/IreP family PP2C-type Ser/Thr phosphatase [Rhodoferax sp.]